VSAAASLGLNFVDEGPEQVAGRYHIPGVRRIQGRLGVL